MTHKVFVALLSVGFLRAVAAALAGPAPFTLYVATNGNDGWSGLLAAPNQTGTYGPLASLTGARERIRSHRAEVKDQPVQVLVRGGTYWLAVPLVLEPQDSGTAEAPVVYGAFQNEKPILSGGRPIGGFRWSGSLWETTIPEVKAGAWYFRQLFVDGHRRPRAHSPNSGYYRIAKLIPGPPVPNAKPFARDRFGFAPGDLQSWERLSDVNMVLMHSWETSIHPLKSVDTVSNIVELAAPMKEWWGLGYWEDHQRYFVGSSWPSPRQQRPVRPDGCEKSRTGFCCY